MKQKETRQIRKNFWLCLWGEMLKVSYKGSAISLRPIGAPIACMCSSACVLDGCNFVLTAKILGFSTLLVLYTGCIIKNCLCLSTHKNHYFEDRP